MAWAKSTNGPYSNTYFSLSPCSSFTVQLSKLFNYSKNYFCFISKVETKTDSGSFKCLLQPEQSRPAQEPALQTRSRAWVLGSRHLNFHLLPFRVHLSGKLESNPEPRHKLGTLTEVAGVPGGVTTPCWNLIHIQPCLSLKFSSSGLIQKNVFSIWVPQLWHGFTFI